MILSRKVAVSFFSPESGTASSSAKWKRGLSSHFAPVLAQISNFLALNCQVEHLARLHLCMARHWQDWQVSMSMFKWGRPMRIKARQRRIRCISAPSKVPLSCVCCYYYGQHCSRRCHHPTATIYLAAWLQ